MSTATLRVDWGNNELLLANDARAGDSLGIIEDVWTTVNDLRNQVNRSSSRPFASLERLMAWSDQKGRSASMVAEMKYGCFTMVTIRMTHAGPPIEFTVPLHSVAKAIDYACALLELTEKKP